MLPGAHAKAIRNALSKPLLGNISWQINACPRIASFYLVRPLDKLGGLSAFHLQGVVYATAMAGQRDCRAYPRRL
ncbi:hypothetical protein PSEUDO8BK_40558 [Pseudomonas sp. 8BK]|nr:hypothetical protein PSEUDO8BK_40558 [Pseudomonas sp. 8BK]